MYLVVWWGADGSGDNFHQFKSKQAAEKCYAELASEGEAQVYLCRVLKEHYIGDEVE